MHAMIIQLLSDNFLLYNVTTRRFHYYEWNGIWIHVIFKLPCMERSQLTIYSGKAKNDMGLREITISFSMYFD